MSTKPYSPVQKDETEAVAADEKEAEDKEEEEKEETIEDLAPIQQLYYHCQRANIEGIKEISSKVTNIDERDETPKKHNPYITKNTALHYAVLSGSLECVKVIYNLEAKPDCINKMKSTPLHLAASLGYTEIVEFLIKIKADIEAKNVIGNTPLHCAIYAGHVDTVRVILDNVEDKREALMLPINGVGICPAKYMAHEEMKKYLRQFFPEKNKKNEKNEHKDQEQQPPPKYDGQNGSPSKYQQNGNDIQEEEEDDDGEADETTGLKTGTATATEQ